MAWELLPTNYTNAVWNGLKKYNQLDNGDGTISLNDVTEYFNKELSFFGAEDANRMNEALNTLMSMVEQGTDLYEAFEIYFNTQKQLFESSEEVLKGEYREEISIFEAMQEQLFNTWFDNIKGQLSEDVAGNLQNEIDQINAKLSVTGGSRVTANVYVDDETIPVGMKVKLEIGTYSETKTVTDLERVIVFYGVLDVGTANLTLLDADNTVLGTRNITIPYYGNYSCDFTSVGWQGWVNASGLSDSSYSDLDAVLADEKAVRQCFTVHASCDYFIEWYTAMPEIMEDFISNRYSMKWIGLRDYICDKLLTIDVWKTEMLESEYWEYILKDHVPIMTSDTTPEGTVSCSSVANYNGVYFNPYNAFARKVTVNATDSYWASTTGAGSWIQYKFVNPISIKKVYLDVIQTPYATNILESTWKLSGSNDGTEWIDLSNNCICPSASSTNPKGATTDIENYDYYMYYRLTALVSNTGNDYQHLCHCQLYGRALNESVPCMTSYTAPLGECSRSGENTSNQFYAYYAFDKNSSNNWVSNEPTSPIWIAYKFNKPIIVRNAYFKSLALVNTPTDYKIQGSNDGTNWTDIFNESGNNEIEKNIVFNNDYAYSIYRFYCNSTYRDALIFIELNFYGVSYSEEEFGDDGIEMLYDNGVEIKEVLVGEYPTGAGAGTVTKDIDSILVKNTTSTEWSPMISCKVDNTSGIYKKLLTCHKNRSGKTRAGANVTNVSTGTWTNLAMSYININTGGTVNYSSSSCDMSVSPICCVDVNSVTQEAYFGDQPGAYNGMSEEISKMYLLK